MKDHSFQVMGKIEGNGSIYTSGTSSFIMETNLVASEDPRSGPFESGRCGY